MKSDAANGKGSYCDNVITVGDDAIAVDDDAITLSDDLITLTDDFGTVRQDMATVQGDLQTLSNDGVNAPPGAAGALAAAHSAIKQAKVTANGYISQVDSIDREAFSIGNGMATGSCAGNGPGSPSSLVAPLK